MRGKHNTWKDRWIYWVVAAIGWWCRRLPKRWAMRLGRDLGILSYHLIKKRREIALGNLQTVFGRHFSKSQCTEICKASFINVGKTCIEFLRFPMLKPENIWSEVTVEGAENLHDALAKGRGAIVFLPHFGNWELLSLVYGALIPDRAKAIAFPLKNTLLNAHIWRNREQMSLRLIPRNRAIRETMRALKNNEAVGFFADQNAGPDGVFVDFLGKPASAARAPAVLALKTGAPLLFSLSVRQPNDRHLVYISNPIYVKPSDDSERDVEVYTSQMLKHLEAYIHKYPEQWLWLHNRWKTQPTDNS